MTRKFLLSGFGVCLLAFGGIAQADPIDLYGYSLNIDGAVSDVIDFYAPLDALPAGVDDTGFDNVTGLGSLLITITGAGAHNILAFFDHEIGEASNTYFNEYGATSGGPLAAGQSWEIDEPSYVFGDIYLDPITLLDGNFLNGALDNTNGVPAADADDVSIAMGWAFNLLAGETATISFLLSEVAPASGFWLQHADPDSMQSLFLFSELSITGGVTPVPEPGTLWLLGAGLLGLGLSRRRQNLAAS